MHVALTMPAEYILLDSSGWEAKQIGIRGLPLVYFLIAFDASNLGLLIINYYQLLLLSIIYYQILVYFLILFDVSNLLIFSPL